MELKIFDEKGEVQMKKRGYIIAGVTILAVLIGVGVYKNYKMDLIIDEIKIEMGEQLSTDVSDYAKGNISHAELDISNVNNRKIGVYEAQIKKGVKRLELKVEVVDTTPPTAIVLEGLEFLTYERVNAIDLITDIKDSSSQITVTFEDGKESHIYSEGGEKQETIILMDESGNINNLDVIFHIVSDNISPILKGVKSIKVYVGDDIDYIKGIKASDDRDGDLTTQIKVNAEIVDLKTPGEYKIVYSVSDRSGNETTNIVSVTVIKDKAPMIKGVSDKTIYINDKVNYLDGVSAEDDRDGNLTSQIKVNYEKVDIAHVGNYEVVYTVIDSNGNDASKKATITVKKKVNTPSGERKASSDSKSSTEAKSSTEKKGTESNKSNQGSTGDFEFFDVAPSGEMPNGDVPASGEHVGTWG